MTRSAAGFTLIELLIVIAVIAVLAAILIPNLIDAIGSTRHTQTVQLITNVDGAIEDYRNNHHPRNHYPPTIDNPAYSTHGIVEVLRERDLFNFRDRDVQETPEGNWEMIDGWGFSMRYQEWRSVPNPPASARNERRFDLSSAGEDGDWETDVIGNWAEMDEEE